MILSAGSRLMVTHCGRAQRNILVGSRHSFTSNINVPTFCANRFSLYGKHGLKQTWQHFASFRTICLMLQRPLFSNRRKLVYSLTLFPLSSRFFKGKEDSPPVHSISEIPPETLAVIPKDVFKKENLKSPKRRGSLLYRFIFAIWDTTWLFFRFLRITFTFGPIFALYPVTFLSDGMRYRWLRLLLYAMENSGPTFVKLGQWASSRRDLFRDDLCDLFIKLHAHTHLHSWFMTRRRMSEAFGKNWRDIFVTFERKPIGSGCIAQVHRAYMKTSMIPDDSIVEEMMTLADEDDDPTVDFAEGLEVVGFVSDSIEDMIDPPNNDTNHPTSTATRSTPFPLTTTTNERTTVTPPPENAETPTDETTTEGEISTQAVIEELENDPNYANAQPDEPASQAAEERPDVIPVAVKVLHPGIYRQVTRDLKILRVLARVMEMCVPSFKWMSLGDCMEEFSTLLTKQIDLRFESRCLEQFVKNFEDNPHIRFPRPIWPYCKRAVLVETYEDGEPIVKYLTADVDTESDDENAVAVGLKEKLASCGVDALLQMLFVDNFVHGDLHPGNILVQNAQHFVPQEENKMMMVDLCDTLIVTVMPHENPIRLVLLDTGITSSLSETDLQNFKDVFTAVIMGEGDQVGELMLKHARYNECQDISGFKTDLGNIVRHFREETIKLGKIQVGELLSQVFRVCYQHKVKIESNFASIILAIFVLEGIGRSLDPELDILERAKPILLGHV